MLRYSFLLTIKLADQIVPFPLPTSVVGRRQGREGGPQCYATFLNVQEDTEVPNPSSLESRPQVPGCPQSRARQSHVLGLALTLAVS